MSATADDARLAGLMDAEVVESAGRMFPVTVEHLPRDIAHPRFVATNTDVANFVPGVAGRFPLPLVSAQEAGLPSSLVIPTKDMFAQAIGFETRGGDTFDRFAAIRARGDRCQVRSLVASDPPPPKVKHKRS